MSKLNACLLAGALTLLPASAMAEISLADMVELDASLSIDESLDFDLNNDADIARGRGPVRPSHHGHAAPPPQRHTKTVTRYRTNVRPRRVVRPVVVVEQPSTVVVDTTPSTYVPKVGSTFGLGVRGLGIFPGIGTNSETDWGFGYYLKWRPSRWVSLEFINDFIFNSNEDYKIPFVFGLRGHIFDYGSLDVYAVAAVTATMEDYDYEYSEYIGGQFGGGVSILLGAFELGVDVRYTIDNGYKGYHEDDTKHGVLFSLNLGLGF